MEVKWIKITTNMFEDEKIDYIESLPEADTILMIWIKLLTLAGKVNDGGLIYLTAEIPYTDQMLAHRFRRPIATIQLALLTFQKLGMIELDAKNYIKIVNWEKHQNIEGLDKIREDTRKRVQKHRAKKALEAKKAKEEQGSNSDTIEDTESVTEEAETGNVTGNVTVTHGNALEREEEREEESEIEKELELEKDLERERDIDLDTDKDLDKEKELGVREPKGSSYHSDQRQAVDRPPKKDPEGSLSPLKGDAPVGTPKPKGDFLQQVTDRWNSLDPNIPKVLAINQGTKRIKNLRARYHQYGPDAIFKAIDNIENSTFLKGYAKDWVITFDWFVKPNNFIKVLEGNYDDMPNGSSKIGATKKEREFMDNMANAMAWAEEK